MNNRLLGTQGLTLNGINENGRTGAHSVCIYIHLDGERTRKIYDQK